MKKSLSLIALVLTLSIISGMALAADSYTVNIKSDKDSTLAGSSLKYTATFTNKVNDTIAIDLSLKGNSYTNWVTLSDYTITLEPKKSETITFYITPPFDTPVEKYLFRFRADPRNKTYESYSKDITIYVIEVSKLDLTAFSTDKTEYAIGEPVTLTTSAKNIGTGKSKATTMKITLKGTKTDETTENIPALEVDEEHVLRKEYTFDPYTDGGDYELEGTLYDSDGTEVETLKASFTIEKKSEITQERKESSTLLEKTITLSAKNTGNDKGTATIKEDKPALAVSVTFNGNPETITEGGVDKYVWTCELDPLENCEVSYTVKYWPYLIAAIIIIIIVMLISSVADKPSISKTFRKGKLRTVSLEIKNNSNKTLMDVQIQDTVPRIFKVDEADISMRPAMMKKKQNGTLIVWKIGKLDPKDERIISYKLKPVLGFEGKIALPSAKFIAKTKRGSTRKAASTQISIN